MFLNLTKNGTTDFTSHGVLTNGNVSLNFYVPTPTNPFYFNIQLETQ